MGSQSEGQYSRKVLLLGTFIWFLAGLFFLYEFFIRATTGAISGLVEHDLMVNAAQYSLIASAYYLAYSGMQVPVGILLDRFGVRALLSVGAVMCTLGCLLFSKANSMHVAWLARFLMGLGSSVGFISLLTVALNWFPRRIFGFFAGMTQVLGFIGPVLSGAPLAWVLYKTGNDWRSIFLFIALFGLVLAVILAIFVRNRNPIIKANQPPLFKGIKMLIKRRQVWWIMAYAFFIYPSIALVGELWGASYFKARGFHEITSNGMLAALWLGMGLGGPIIGIISDIIKRRKVVLLACALGGVVVSIILVCASTQSAWVYDVILLLMGIMAGGQTLSFAVMSEHVPEVVKATAMGCNNMAVMLGGMAIQILAGYVLEYTSKLGNYTLLNYQYAMAVTIGFFALAFVFGFGIKETHAKPFVE